MASGQHGLYAIRKKLNELARWQITKLKPLSGDTMNKQYQYRMKCRKAPNQNWSSWGDCSLGSAYRYLEDAKDESNIWTYEVREIVPVTEIINENPK